MKYNKTKISKAIIMVISILLSTAIMFLVGFNSYKISATFDKDYPYEETYDIYKGYADTYIKNWHKNSIDDTSVLAIKTEVDEKSITVIVDGAVCNVEAKYPIEFVTESDKKANMIILVEEGTYNNYSDVKGNFSTIMRLIGGFLLFTIGLYALGDLFYDHIIRTKEAIKKKKHKEN